MTRRIIKIFSHLGLVANSFVCFKVNRINEPLWGCPKKFSSFIHLINVDVFRFYQKKQKKNSKQQQGDAGRKFEIRPRPWTQSIIRD